MQTSIDQGKTCSSCGLIYFRKTQNYNWFAASKFCSKTCQWNHARLSGYVRTPLPDKKCITCGSKIEFKGKYYAPHRAAKRKFCSYKCRSGKNHSNWNGGTYEVGKGYLKTNIGIGKTQYLHRVIAENVLGRKLTRDETVHHINGDKTDNRNQNILICSNSYHRWLHDEMSRRYAAEHF